MPTNERFRAIRVEGGRPAILDTENQWVAEWGSSDARSTYNRDLWMGFLREDPSRRVELLWGRPHRRRNNANG